MTTAANMFVIGEFPQLRLIAWNRKPADAITGEDAFGLYEANWRFVEQDQLAPHERGLIAHLTQVHGKGVMNV